MEFHFKEKLRLHLAHVIDDVLIVQQGCLCNKKCT